MYNTSYFKAGSEKEVIDFMHQHPFVTLTGCDVNLHPVATHIPVLIEEREGKMFLLAHIRKQTDHHKAFLNNPNVLAIFSGAHAYISASWYVDKQQASTWNYQAVHASGILRFLGEEALHNILHRLTAFFESDPNSPSLKEHLSTEYVDHLIKAIIAFEIEVTEIAHVFKLNETGTRKVIGILLVSFRKAILKHNKWHRLWKKIINYEMEDVPAVIANGVWCLKKKYTTNGF